MADLTKKIPQERVAKYEQILKTVGIAQSTKDLTKEELIELKSHAIVKSIKKKKYVRN